MLIVDGEGCRLWYDLTFHRVDVEFNYILFHPSVCVMFIHALGYIYINILST